MWQIIKSFITLKLGWNLREYHPRPQERALPDERQRGDEEVLPATAERQAVHDQFLGVRGLVAAKKSSGNAQRSFGNLKSFRELPRKFWRNSGTKKKRRNFSGTFWKES